MIWSHKEEGATDFTGKTQPAPGPQTPGGMMRTIASMGFFQLIGIVAAAIRSKLFAVLLGPAGFGVVATIDQLVMSAVQIFNLGLPLTALKFLSRDHSLGEPQFRKTYAAFFRAIAALALVATVVMLVLLPVNLARMDTQLAAYRGTVTIALLGIPGTMIMMLLVNVLAARRDSVESVILTAVSAIMLLVAGGIGCLIGGINGIYWGTVPTTTLLMVGTVIYFRRKMNLSIGSRAAGLWAKLKSNRVMLETTLGIYLGMVSSAAQLFLARYVSITHLGAEAAGLVQACLSVALSIGAVLGPANTLYFSPYVNRSIPAAEKMAVADKFLPRLVFLFCLGALPVLLFPELVLRVLFSNRFTSAASILPWFVVWQCLYHVSNVYQQILLGVDDALGLSFVTSLGNLACVGCSVLLIGHWGLLGVAVGFVVGGILTTVATAIRLRRKHGLTIPLSAPRMVAFILIGFGAVAGLGRVTAEGTIGGAAARILMAAVFVLGLWLVLPGNLRSDLVTNARAQCRKLLGRFALGKS